MLKDDYVFDYEMTLFPVKCQFFFHAPL